MSTKRHATEMEPSPTTADEQKDAKTSKPQPQPDTKKEDPFPLKPNTYACIVGKRFSGEAVPIQAIFDHMNTQDYNDSGLTAVEYIKKRNANIVAQAENAVRHWNQKRAAYNRQAEAYNKAHPERKPRKIKPMTTVEETLQRNLRHRIMSTETWDWTHEEFQAQAKSLSGGLDGGDCNIDNGGFEPDDIQLDAFLKAYDALVEKGQGCHTLKCPGPLLVWHIVYSEEY